MCSDFYHIKYYKPSTKQRDVKSNSKTKLTCESILSKLEKLHSHQHEPSSFSSSSPSTSQKSYDFFNIKEIKITKSKNNNNNIKNELLKDLVYKEYKKRRNKRKRKISSIDKQFLELSKKQNKIIDDVLYKRRRSDEVMIDLYNVKLFYSKMKCLKNGQWLNDEVINFYFKILEDRNKRENDLFNSGNEEGKPKCYFFNTFFYFKMFLIPGHCYENVKRWTRKVDLFTYDKVLIPIHLGNHWVLGVINFKNNRLEYYDSLCSPIRGNKILNNLLQYLRSEMLDKKGIDKSFDEMDFYIPQNCPQQANGFDCGVFTCKCADFLSQNLPLNFSQSNMKYFRRRMCYEIVNAFAL